MAELVRGDVEEPDGIEWVSSGITAILLRGDGSAMVLWDVDHLGVQGTIFIHPRHELAQVTVAQHPHADYLTYTFHPQAYAVLAAHGMLQQVMDVVGPRGEGTYVIPRSVIDREAAADVEHQLDYLSSFDDASSAGDRCVMPHCLQDGEDKKRGFVLCREHADALQDWDDLVNAG